MRDVREIEHLWIPLSDGTRLGARLWLPRDADQDPVPAVLEYIPYRKTDGTAVRDAARQPYLAAHGYAAVRVDLRGSGDSDGLLHDEYLQQELDDALEVIAWLAEQPWCTGAVGMTGISWGGFNALQVAALRPPALRAIISVCSTDDRYADDVHYTGGCVVGSDMLAWASTMLANGARPPDPHHVGAGWREAWFERLEVAPFVDTWLTHQRRDAYWQHGSVCEDYAAIDCAVYMVGGWDDAYRDAVLRVLEGYDGPRKGLIGPWGHVYPDQGRPGAPVDFLAESVRYWDHWLKGIDNGIMDEPMLRVFLGSTTDPWSPDERPGMWADEPTWPRADAVRERWAIGARVLGDPGPEVVRHELLGRQSAGLDAGAYMGLGVIADLPGEQSREDGMSLAYTSDPLTQPLTILGQASVDLEVAVDRPDAAVVVRLCEVTRTGTSRLVARGLLNLTHRDRHRDPVAMQPGRRTTVTIPLSAAGHTFAAGSRLRVAVSPTYWPWMWPSPEPVTLSVFAGGESALELPVRSPRPEDGELPAFVVTGPPAMPREQRGMERSIVQDVVSGRSTVVTSVENETALSDGLRLAKTERNTHSIIEGDPLSAFVRCERTTALTRGDWWIRIETVSTMSADASVYRLTNRVDAYEGEVRVAARSWTTEIPRDRGPIHPAVEPVEAEQVEAAPVS